MAGEPCGWSRYFNCDPATQLSTGVLVVDGGLTIPFSGYQHVTIDFPAGTEYMMGWGAWLRFDVPGMRPTVTTGQTPITEAGVRVNTSLGPEQSLTCDNGEQLGITMVPAQPSLNDRARIRGAMWTARWDGRYGPRPGQPSNILATDYAQYYDGDERAKMYGIYTGGGYTHGVTGPLVDTDGYHGYYPTTPDEPPTQAQFDGYLDVMQEFQNAGIQPVHFVCPNGWTLDRLKRDLEPLYRQPRAQALLGIVVPTGWEPAGYERSSFTWAQYLQWGAQVFPDALRLIHLQTDKDAPAGADQNGDDNLNPNGNADAWARVAPYLHGWLVQNGPFYQKPADNQPLASAFAELWNPNVRTSYTNRFANGYAGWPTFSAWGSNSPIRVYNAECTSYAAFWSNLPESDSKDWGDLAMASGAAGYLDGGRVAVP